MAYILLIDDDALYRTNLRGVLEGAGHEVEVAGNGLQGLDRYHLRRPDLIVTEIIMPEMDGLETIIELRRLDPGVKIIAISANTGALPGYLGPAKLLGAAQAFEKPVDIPVLLAAVTELTSGITAPAAP
jgi:CheY-like chemotaxis protein